MNVPHLVIIASITLITIGIGLIFQSAYATIEALPPQYTAVAQYNYTENTERIMMFENEDVVIPAGLPQVDLPSLGNSSYIYLYDLLAGPENQTTGYSTRVVFDLTKFPQSDLWNTVSSIDSVQLQELIDSVPHYTAKKTYLSVSSCTDSTWYSPFLENELGKMLKIKPDVDKEFKAQTRITIKENTQLNQTNYVTYRNLFLDMSPSLNDSFYESKTTDIQPCENDTQTSGVFVVQKDDLPKVYVSDVTDSVKKALDEKATSITFIIYGNPVPEEVQGGEITNPTSLLYMVSFQDTKYPSNGVSKSAVPTLIITYTTNPSIPSTLLQPSTLFTIIGVAAPAIAWFYKDEIRKHLKGKQKPS